MANFYFSEIEKLEENTHIPILPTSRCIGASVLLISSAKALSPSRVTPVELNQLDFKLY